MDKLTEVIEFIQELAEDRRVPRNIRALIEEASTSLKDEKQDMVVKLSTAISLLDESSNDPNIPSHTRTQIWNIVSMLESLQSEAE
ncbi:MAG: UPF0147 family protein [archaeon]